jgi:hypothetical protein
MSEGKARAGLVRKYKASTTHPLAVQPQREGSQLKPPRPRHIWCQSVASKNRLGA